MNLSKGICQVAIAYAFFYRYNAIIGPRDVSREGLKLTFLFQHPVSEGYRRRLGNFLLTYLLT